MASTDRPFKVDGVSIPTPTEYKPGIEDLSSEATGRTLDGVMHKDVVAVKAYYQCTWKKLSWDDASILLRAVDGKSKVQFTHADPRVAGQWITKTFYIGKKDLGALDLSKPTSSRLNWKDITLTFTEI